VSRERPAVAEWVRCRGAPGGSGCQQRAVPTSRSPCLGGMRFHSGRKPRLGAFQIVSRQRLIYLAVGARRRFA